MSDRWFSAMVRLVNSVEGIGPTTFVRSVFVFRAAGWEAAKRRALELGRKAEASYRNGDDQLVSRRLLLLETLDLLGDEIDDGREVYTEPVPVAEDPSANLDFVPEESKPTQSGV